MHTHTVHPLVYLVVLFLLHKLFNHLTQFEAVALTLPKAPFEPELLFLPVSFCDIVSSASMADTSFVTLFFSFNDLVFQSLKLELILEEDAI